MRTFQYLPIFAAFCFLTTTLGAQQIPFLNHYTWNSRLFNPASQGADQMGYITAVYRSQFQEIEDSQRPNTYLIHADFSPLVNERIGLGVQVLGDKVHVINRFQLSGFFGYHLITQDQLRLSLGAAASLVTQNFNFEGVRVSDVLDLAVFSDQTASTQFDGGPGVSLEYRPSGSLTLLVDAAATQLFSSDIEIRDKQNTGTNGAVYDLIPHLLINSRIRYQGNAFVLEPNIAFRALTGERSLDAGKLDFNLNVFFLKENRVMVGAGYRTGQGGVHFQLGVSPASSIRLIASAELHSALGTSYEVGASYAFGKQVPAPLSEPPEPAPVIPVPAQGDLLATEYQNIQDLIQATKPDLLALNTLYDNISTNINTARAVHSRRLQLQATDSCSSKLSGSSLTLATIQQSISGIDLQRIQAERKVQNVTSQGGLLSEETLTTLKAIKEVCAALNGEQQDLLTRQQALQEQCTNLRPNYSERACIVSGDQECVTELFQQALETVSAKPAEMFPLQALVMPGRAAITYHYPDDKESYLPGGALTGLADHVVRRINQAEQQGLTFDYISLATELQEDQNTLAFRLGMEYNGELGDTQVSYSLTDNLSNTPADQNLAIAKGSAMTLESLAVLKLAALKQHLESRGVPANKINLQVRYNHESNIYREESKIILHLKH
ncbi:MAG: type IX secretion system membrane protein PorP/SprF [Bacteroidetes bacterium]|nr:MAG: type IX secretion system membrane protein PorP/SprF [Bacteroidota bacterium]